MTVMMSRPSDESVAKWCRTPDLDWNELKAELHRARAAEEAATKRVVDRLAEEERRAWDLYVLDALRYVRDYGLRDVPEEELKAAEELANRLLGLRRKRFGAGDQADDVRRMSVPRGLLLEAADLLQKGGPPVNCEAVANVLRALVSE